MAKNTGGPAFARAASENRTMGTLPDGDSHIDAQKGMDMRDYFAAKALPAVMEEYFRGNGTCLGTEHAPRNCAAHAYTYADAMLAERIKS